MALWDKLTVAKNKRDVAETRSQTETEDTAKTQVRCKKKVPHLTELRLVIQLGNPAPVETKKKRQTNKTAGAGGAPLPQPAEAGAAEGWSPRAQPPRGAGNGRSPCGVAAHSRQLPTQFGIRRFLFGLPRLQFSVRGPKCEIILNVSVCRGPCIKGKLTTLILHIVTNDQLFRS